MPVWAAVLDGVNDRATFPSVTTSNNIDVEATVTFNSLAGGAILSDAGVANFFRYNAGTLRFRCLGFLGNSMSFTPTIGQKYVLRAELRPTGVELFVDGSSIGSGGNGTPTGMLINTIGFFNSTFYLDIVVERLTVTDNTTPDNSIDLYNDVIAGSSVNWPDQTTNNRNATLINTPTGGTQWQLVGNNVESITLDPGSFSLVGAPISTQIITPIESGSYSMTGSAIGTMLSIVMDGGSFALTGSAINKSIILPIDNGSYSLTGTDINFSVFTDAESITLEPGSFALTGVPISTQVITPIQSGLFSLNGTNINTQVSFSIDAGSFLLTGANQDIQFIATIDSGRYIMTGTPITLIYSGDSGRIIGKVTAKFAEGYAAEFVPTTITAEFGD